MKKFIYRTILYALPIIIALLYFLIFVGIKPPVGDLARLSAQKPEYKLPELTKNHAIAPCRDEELYNFNHRDNNEIAVFGDSFSATNDRIWPSGRWHQFMGADISKRVVSVATVDNPFSQYLSTLTYNPELLGDTVVLESVERNMIWRLAYLDFDAIANPSEKHKKKSPKWFRDIRLNLVLSLHYYKHKLGLDLQVMRSELDGTYFSYKPTQLSYIREDVTELPSEWEITTAMANLQRIDSLSQAAGITLFLVAIPDKYTVYHHHIIGNDGIKKLLESPCPFDTLPRFINTLPPIATLVASGTKDVYLPDDTHFSNPTCQVIGQYVASRISTSSDTIYGRP